jgi:hypothetical protein
MNTSLTHNQQQYHNIINNFKTLEFQKLGTIIILYSSPNIIRMIKSTRMRWAGHVARMGETRNAYRILVGKPEGKKPLERPRRNWVNNIKIDLKTDRMGWCGLDRSGSG